MSILTNIKDTLFHFTKTVSSAVVLSEIAVKKVLSNLYIQNKTVGKNTPLVYDGDSPYIYPQSYGVYLDRLGYMFDVLRNSNEEDDSYRQRILFSIAQNSTKDGISKSVQFIFAANNIAANVEIRESFEYFFDGSNSTFDTPIRSAKGTMMYGITIIVTPTNLKLTSIFVDKTITYPSDQYVLDDNGNKIYNLYNNMVKIYVWDAAKNQLVFNKRKNIYSTKIVEAFHVTSLKYLINEICAAGVKVNRVIIREVGAAGSNGETALAKSFSPTITPGINPTPTPIFTPPPTPTPIPPPPPPPSPPPLPQVQAVSYIEDTTTEFSNPERGLYSTSTLTNPVAASPWATSPMTLQIKEYTLPTNSSSLPVWFLNTVSSDLAAFRNSDVKVILLFAYTYVQTGADAPINIVLEHIQQLGPILTTYSDVIALTHAGFAGAWGEWGYNYSTNNLVLGPSNNPGLWRKEIKDALLQYFPGMIAFRRPNFIGPADITNSNNFGDWFSSLPSTAIRFGGSLQSRVALFNDCFLSDATNGSWYDNYDGTTTSQDHAIAAAVTRITAAGGETCSSGGLNAYNTDSAALAEMTASNWDYLNASYWTTMYNSWTISTRAEIARRLGYRYVLTDSSLPTTASPGETISISLTIKNVGFGKLYNARPLNIVFIGSSTQTVTALSDCRREMPLGGETKTLTFNVTVPLAIAGVNSIHLELPDNVSSRVGKKIRFANVGMWDSITGYNNLNANITIV